MVATRPKGMKLSSAAIRPILGRGDIFSYTILINVSDSDPVVRHSSTISIFLQGLTASIILSLARGASHLISTTRNLILAHAFSNAGADEDEQV